MRKPSSFIKTGIFCLSAAVIFFTACRKEEPIHGVYYRNGEGYVDENQNVVISNQEIPSQLNVDGNATLGEGTVIGSDLNTNETGTTVIEGNTVIKNNANINGSLIIKDYTTIGTDFNLNNSGTIVIDMPFDSMVVSVGNNMNVNDSLIIRRGILEIGTDFNINATGIVNVSNHGKLIVNHDMNQSGQLFGNQNVEVKHVYNNNNPAGTFEEPLPQYEPKD